MVKKGNYCSKFVNLDIKHRAMEQKTKPTVKKQKIEQHPEEKIPWWFGLAVKDLVKPIIVRRSQIIYTVLGLVALGFVAQYLWDNFLRQPTGDELLNEIVAVAGGMPAWNSIKDGQFTRTHNLYNQSGDLLEAKEETFYFKKTNQGLKLQIKSSTDDGSEVWVGKDKQGFWASKDSEAADPRVVAKDEGMMCDSKFCEPLCASAMAFYRFSMPFKLKDPGIMASLGSTDFSLLNFNPMQHLDIEPLVLDISYDPEVGRDRWKFYIDPNDKLIHKMEYYNKSDMGETRPEEIYWTDHRQEAGITFSHKWIRYWPNGKIMDEYIYSDVDFNKEIEDDFFDRPEDLALISGN